MKTIKKIVVTGPESSGKTTLCKKIADHYGVKWVEEFAREYLKKNNGNYHFKDLLNIAQGQHELIQHSKNKAQEMLLCDTDLLTIKIWSEYKYQKVDVWIENTLRENLPTLYLLCQSDIPWEEDPLREHPEKRNELFEIYLKEIKALGADFEIISGNQEKRISLSITAISRRA